MSNTSTDPHFIWMGDRYVALTGDQVDSPDNYPDLVYFALALSRIPRFGGNTETDYTETDYTVAMHLMTTASIAIERNRQSLSRQELAGLALACLCHDLHEAVIGDVISPIKGLMGQPWYDFEDRIEHAVLAKFGLTDLMVKWRDEVHECDLIALELEKRTVLPAVVQGDVWTHTSRVELRPEYRVFNGSPDDSEQGGLQSFSLLASLWKFGEAKSQEVPCEWAMGL